MQTTESSEVPLPLAAQRLGMSWAAAWKLVLTGELIARRVNARWLVDERSIVRCKNRLRRQSIFRHREPAK